MHIEYLYYFRDFSKSLSISKTASEYFMTPQGLSRALHQLEKDFGVTLMTYQNNVVSLTPAGAALADRVDEICDLCDAIRGSMMKYKLEEVSELNEHVRITVTSCISHYLSVLIDIQRPGLFPFGVKVTEANLFHIVPSIIARGSEHGFAIISLPNIAKYRDVVVEFVEKDHMVYRPLLRTPLVALVSSFSPLARKDVVTPRDVDPYPVARFRDTVLGDALDDYIKVDNVRTVTNASSVVFFQIKDRQAVGFAPKLVEGVRLLPDNIITRPTEGFFETEFGVLVPEDQVDSPVVSEVVKHIERTVRKEAKGPRFSGTYTLAFEEA